jgi:hypothetical protein
MAEACCTRHKGKQQAFSAEEERMLKIARTANDLSRFFDGDRAALNSPGF